MPDFCTSTPCQNEGVCSQTASGYTCRCKNDYTGNNCDSKCYCYYIHMLTVFSITMKLSNALCRFCVLIVILYVVVPIKMNMCFHQERLCANTCEDLEVDGIYVTCDDCRKYLVCKDGSEISRICPDKPNWGFNVDTRQCQYKSPHCFDCNGRLHILILHTSGLTHI